MQNVLLSLHVLAGIVFVGGSAVATSLFPRYAPVAEPAADSPRSLPVAKALHRVTGGYAIAAVSVPAVGIALAVVQGRMGEIWITLAMVITALAGVLLATQIYPRQRDVLAEPGDERPLKRLSMLAGVYNLLWAAVVVLMIVRPGYTPEA